MRNGNSHHLLSTFAKAARAGGASIESITSAPWLDDFRKRAARPYPNVFDTLLSSLTFTAFDFAGIRFFANDGSGEREELRLAVTRDPIIYAVTTVHGFLQFGRPSDGSYDPICFDLNRAAGDFDSPVVRLDHEAILCHERIVIVSQLADSFAALMAHQAK